MECLLPSRSPTLLPCEHPSCAPLIAHVQPCAHSNCAGTIATLNHSWHTRCRVRFETRHLLSAVRASATGWIRWSGSSSATMIDAAQPSPAAGRGWETKHFTIPDSGWLGDKTFYHPRQRHPGHDAGKGGEITTLMSQHSCLNTCFPVSSLGVSTPVLVYSTLDTVTQKSVSMLNQHPCLVGILMVAKEEPSSKRGHGDACASAGGVRTATLARAPRRPLREGRAPAVTRERVPAVAPMVAPLRGAWAFGTGQTSTVPTSNMLGPEVHASVTCVGFTNDPNSLICRKATRLVSPWRATRPIALKYQTHPDARGRGGRCAWAT